jgi:hypothetical protein
MNDNSEPRDLAPHELKELVGSAKDAWARAPRDALNASFDWKGQRYIASCASFQLQIHTTGGIRIHY